jgi:F-type H+-transporting ATPase subunit b
VLFELQENLVFWTVISFGILLLILWKFGFKPITDILEQRERRIRESLEQAEHTRTEAERLLREYEARLEKARQEAQKLIGEGKELGERLKEEIIKKAQAEADKIINEAREQIERDSEQAIAELRAEAATLSIELASKIIERSLRPEDHEELIKKYLGGVGKLQ